MSTSFALTLASFFAGSIICSSSIRIMVVIILDTYWIWWVFILSYNLYHRVCNNFECFVWNFICETFLRIRGHDESIFSHYVFEGCCSSRVLVCFVYCGIKCECVSVIIAYKLRNTICQKKSIKLKNTMCNDYLSLFRAISHCPECKALWFLTSGLKIGVMRNLQNHISYSLLLDWRSTTHVWDISWSIV